MRFQGADGSSLFSQLAYDPQDGSVPASILNKAEYHWRRTVATADFDWLCE